MWIPLAATAVIATAAIVFACSVMRYGYRAKLSLRPFQMKLLPPGDLEALDPISGALDVPRSKVLVAARRTDTDKTGYGSQGDPVATLKPSDTTKQT